MVAHRAITWTTEYHAKAIGELRAQGRDVLDELLSFIAPGHRENINFFGFITVDIEAALAWLFAVGDPALVEAAGRGCGCSRRCRG
ncbi:Tn3 family transposase [Nonomuraea sp. NPDC005983]|uniref:Tn3 family transposase n=1 Tax=Nonomuraea sp. NPDC005983 TaxID=3155595 RepID=UPI00339EEFED